jgi:hypothetical protein
MMRALSLLLLTSVLASSASQAAEAVYTQQAATQFSARQTGANTRTQQQVDAYEQMQASMWGISIEEVRRAELLRQGPRGAFSIPAITPIEILGIHARSPAERQKYAEAFAKVLHADTERVLAWSVAHAEAMARLFPDEPVIDFSNSPKPAVDPSVAEAALVPQSAITPVRKHPAKSKKVAR